MSCANDYRPITPNLGKRSIEIPFYSDLEGVPILRRS